MSKLIPCDFCPREAIHHSVAILDGVKMDRHLCQEHFANDVAIPPRDMFSENEVASATFCTSISGANGILKNLDGTVNFARRTGRMPSGQELMNEILSPSHGPFIQIELNLNRQLSYMEKFAEFIRQNGRLPLTNAEMPKIDVS